VERLLLSLGDRESPPREGRVLVFFVVGVGVDREPVLCALAALRARGVACEMDYAGRSKKGQLTHAARLGATTTVIVDAGGTRILRPGGDEATTLDELVEGLAP
jgi:histidyl-tRNA synthetase